MNELLAPAGGLPSVLSEPVTLAQTLGSDGQRIRDRLNQLLNNPNADPNDIAQLSRQLYEQFIANNERYADNTWKTLRSAWGTFESWCQQDRICPLPCQADRFIQFLTERCQQYKKGVVEVFIWAVRTVHRAAGLPDPSADFEAQSAMAVLRKQRRRDGETVRQASPFRDAHLQALCQCWAEDQGQNLRNRALLSLAYETLLRESELVGVKVEDLIYEFDQPVHLFVARTKTGTQRTIPLNDQLVGLLEQYIEQYQLGQGDWLFPRIHASGSLPEAYRDKALSTKAVERVFARAHQVVASAEPRLVRGIRRWSGHSARVGACQDLLASGASVLEVQQAGDWQSPAMVYRYGHKILSRENAMVKFRAR